MTNCTTSSIEFTRCKRRKVQANFGGGEITSDAGAILLSQADKIINLTDRITATAFDPCNQEKIKHTILAMLRQLVYGLALGYEDPNDHDTLRNDTAQAF